MIVIVTATVTATAPEYVTARGSAIARGTATEIGAIVTEITIVTVEIGRGPEIAHGHGPAHEIVQGTDTGVAEVSGRTVAVDPRTLRSSFPRKSFLDLRKRPWRTCCGIANVLRRSSQSWKSMRS